MAKKKAAARVAKSAELDLVTAAAAVNYADSLTVDGVVGELAQLQIQSQAAFASLSGQFAAKLEESKRLDLAIEEKGRRFEQLTGKVESAVALEELNIDIETLRDTWEREKETREREWENEATEHENRQKALAETADFQYNQRVARHEMDYSNLVKKHEQEEAIRQSEKERDWSLREDAIASREKELTDLRARVAAFPSELDKAVTSAVEKATSALTREHAHKMELINTDTDNKVALAEQQRKAIEAALKIESDRNKSLEQRAESAEKRTLEVMNSALNVEAANRRAEAVAAAAGASANKSGNSK